MKGIDKLYASDFNDMGQAWQPDGTVIITLYKRWEDKKYELHVQDLYGEHEKVLKDKTIPVVVPDWIIERMKEAKKPKPAKKGK